MDARYTAQEDVPPLRVVDSSSKGSLLNGSRQLPQIQSVDFLNEPSGHVW